MTLQSGFFNSINGDRKYDARWFAEYFASFIGNGVFPNPSTGLQVVEGDNMNIVVRAGKGWINGFFIVNDSDYTLTLDNADGVLKRIDRVVMRLNYLTRQIEIAVKKGTFASNPVAPTLQRDTEFYELGLADILINAGTVQIIQANITDTRLNNDVCGIVHGLIKQVDTATIFNQYQAWFESVKDGTEQEIEDWQQIQYQDFTAWFNTLQDILDGDVAANLASRIASLENQFTKHLDENNPNAHKASNISVVNPETQVAQDMQTFAEQLFTGVSNGKQAIGTAITDVDENVIVPTNPSFVDLATAIGQISTGKKFLIGQSTAYTASTYTLDVINLGFIPKYFLAVGVTSPYSGPEIVFFAPTQMDENSGSFVCGTSKDANIHNGNIVSRTSSLVRVQSTSIRSGAIYFWIAIE